MLAMWKLGPFHLIVVMGAAIAAVLLLAVATEIPPQMFAPASSADYEEPVMAGKIESPDVTESSGLSASECQDVLWTHNDAGSAPLVFAMDFTGKHLGAWRVEDSRSTDWESIATYKNAEGKCSLLIGDIGDNDKSRQNVEIYRLAEPAVAPSHASSSAASPLPIETVEVMKFTYSDGSHDAETLLVHPKSGDIYIVTKERKGPASVHRIGQQFGSTEVLKTEKIGDISAPSTPEGLLTGGSFSPDGTRVMLCDKKGGYELVLPAGSTNADDIWKQKPVFVNIGDRKQGEGVSYGRDGMTLYASSEKKNAPLFMIKRKA